MIKLWRNMKYWQKGAMIGIIIFFIISASVSLLYFSKDEHSDMDGIVFIIPAIPLILITTLPTGFQENALTRFIIGFWFPVTLYLFSFLTWLLLGSLVGMLYGRFFKNEIGASPL